MLTTCRQDSGPSPDLKQLACYYKSGMERSTLRENQATMTARGVKSPHCMGRYAWERLFTASWQRS